MFVSCCLMSSVPSNLIFVSANNAMHFRVFDYLGMFSVTFGRVDVPISVVNTFLLNEMIKHTFSSFSIHWC